MTRISGEVGADPLFRRRAFFIDGTWHGFPSFLLFFGDVVVVHHHHVGGRICNFWARLAVVAKTFGQRCTDILLS